MIKITFEDCGQDFYVWLIDTKTMKIHGCYPFQASVWVSNTVINRDPKPGDKLTIQFKHGARQLNVPVEKVEDLSTKSAAAHMVLDLMDHGASYTEALEMTLVQFKGETTQFDLEIELDIYC